MDAAERRATVLKTVVEEYVRTAAPVASQTVTESRDLGVSSATVRNDMTQLEREGFLAQPHTSAGRIPTDQGYRYFVDHFTAAGGLPVGQRRAVADFFATTHRALEDLLNETSQLLANLTSHAAVVVGPDADAVRVRCARGRGGGDYRLRAGPRDDDCGDSPTFGGAVHRLLAGAGNRGAGRGIRSRRRRGSRGGRLALRTAWHGCRPGWRIARLRDDLRSVGGDQPTRS